MATDTVGSDESATQHCTKLTATNLTRELNHEPSTTLLHERDLPGERPPLAAGLLPAAIQPITHHASRITSDIPCFTVLVGST